MIELFIERWTGFDGNTEYRWSLWSEGRRIQMGPHGFSSVGECEAEARDYCLRALGRNADRVSKL